jgi:hypothetical protein
MQHGGPATNSIVNQKMAYLQEVWPECCDQDHLFRNAEALISLHTLLQLLVDEAANHALKSDGVRQYLLKKLGLRLKDLPSLPHRITSDLKLILREMNSGRSEFLRQIAMEALVYFKDGGYFRALHEALKAIVLTPTWGSGDVVRIRSMVQQIVIEFLLKSYSLKTVTNIGRDIFDDWTESNGRVFTQFPTGIPRAQWETG